MANLHAKTAVPNTRRKTRDFILKPQLYRSTIAAREQRECQKNDEQVRRLISYEPDIIEFCRSAAGYTASEHAARSRGATAKASTFVPSY